MEGVVQRGTAARAKSLGKIIAGKTGTTNDSLDTWFIGYTPILATATYIGHDTPKTLGKSATGSSIPLPIFIDFMANAYKDVPSLAFRVPDSIVEIRVDPVTGKQYDGPGSILEAFKKDNDDHQPNDEREIRSAPEERENDAGIY